MATVSMELCPEIAAIEVSAEAATVAAVADCEASTWEDLWIAEIAPALSATGWFGYLGRKAGLHDIDDTLNHVYLKMAGLKVDAREPLFDNWRTGKTGSIFLTAQNELIQLLRHVRIDATSHTSGLGVVDAGCDAYDDDGAVVAVSAIAAEVISDTAGELRQALAWCNEQAREVFAGLRPVDRGLLGLAFGIEVPSEDYLALARTAVENPIAQILVEAARVRAETCADDETFAGSGLYAHIDQWRRIHAHGAANAQRIATVLGVEDATVHTRLMRARKALTKGLLGAARSLPANRRQAIHDLAAWLGWLKGRRHEQGVSDSRNPAVPESSSRKKHRKARRE